MVVTQVDTMKTEILQLGQKVDQLFPALEELTRLVSNTLAEVGSPARTASTGERIGTLNGYDSSYSHHHVLEELMDHKDILIDSEGTELYAKKSDRVLPPELQIQRLTAQLTAAYNRIAALEDQLLSRRSL
jgi:hypothetical protein